MTDETQPPEPTQSVNQTKSPERENLPTAEVRQRAQGGLIGLIRRSKFWWLTLICVIVAAGLTWYSSGGGGPEIVIHFDEGHGIKAGDTMRHRGIEVGQVTSVLLNSDLTGIDVSVVLNPAAAGLAREGSRFWIVRPQLSLTEVSGLDTALGAKYLAVDPGEITGSQQNEFIGLPAAPPDSLHHDGIELVLRGAERRGLSVGAPVTYRGIDVGTILGVQLAPDANGVDVRVRVDAPFRRLVRASSKFWIVSGINFDVGLSGVEFSADSLASIARGGVAFLTPDGGSTEDVHSGQVYTLHDKPDDNWTKSAANISLLDVPVSIATLRVEARWQQKRFGFTRDRSLSGYALVLGGETGPKLIAPSDLLMSVEEAVPDSYSLEFFAHDGTQVARLTDGLSPADGFTGDVIGVFELPDNIADTSATRSDQLRIPAGPESVVVIPDPKSTRVISLGENQLAPGDKKWNVTTEESISDSWHGAPVVGAEDGKVIGVLTVQGGVAAVTPLAEE